MSNPAQCWGCHKVPIGQTKGPSEPSLQTALSSERLQPTTPTTSTPSNPQLMITWNHSSRNDGFLQVYFYIVFDVYVHSIYIHKLYIIRSRNCSRMYVYTLGLHNTVVPSSSVASTFLSYKNSENWGHDSLCAATGYTRSPSFISQKA